MGRRLKLQTLLEGVAGDGIKVYFQPPSDVRMTYPCIVYQRDVTSNRYADNVPYRTVKRYQVTVISRNPDDGISDRIATLPMCSHNRFFVAGNLNHDVFILYF